jgi:hypothetical protein
MVFKKKKELGLKYKHMYWLMGRHLALSAHNKLVLCNLILKPVWTYGIQLWGCTKLSNIAIIQRFQNKVLWNMRLGMSGTPTTIGTSKWKWLWQKLDGSLGSMRRGSLITTTSKRSSCSTIMSCNASLKEQNPFSW